MSAQTREQLALAICEGLTDEQLATGPKTAQLWAAFNTAYFQVNLLAETIEDVLDGTRFESHEHRDGNGMVDVLETGPTQPQLMLWTSILRSALKQAAELKPGDVPSEYRTGQELIQENINEGMPEMPVPNPGEIH
jgi:hypothetical protein